MAEILLIIGALVVVVILCVAVGEAVFEWGKAESKLAILKDLGTIVGAGVGGGYVVYKLSTGWLVVNLSITLEVQRKSLNATRDHFKVRAILEKGNTDALWLEGLVFDITDITNPAATVPLPSITPVALLTRTNNKPICLAPNETAEFAAYTVVPANSIIHVKATLKADRPFYDFPGKLLTSSGRARLYAEFHSDTISLP